MANVFLSDLGTVFALFHFQSGLYAFMLYELCFYLGACIALVSFFVSLRIAFTEGHVVCNLSSGTHVQCIVCYRMAPTSRFATVSRY